MATYLPSLARGRLRILDKDIYRLYRRGGSGSGSGGGGSTIPFVALWNYS